MSPRPGTEFEVGTRPPSRSAPTDTGVAFFAGLAERGPTDRAVLVNNVGEFERVFGVRQSYSLLWDAVDVLTREGGAKVYVLRVAGPAAVLDTVALVGAAAAPSIRVDSIGPYDSGLAVQVVAGVAAGTFVLVITENGVEVERSPDLVDPIAAATWSQNSRYVRVTAVGVVNPVIVAATPLAGGDDDRAGITDVERTAALDLFTSDLGPGQIAYPGATTTAVHVALLNHAKTHVRTALLDGPDTASSTTLIAAADGVRLDATLTDDAESYGGLFAPWVLVPGVTRGTTRTVPPSAIVAGVIARSDGLTRNPNVAAAGDNGQSRYALGLSQPAWTDDTRETLNEAGVDVVRMLYGGVRVYGYRTLTAADDPWVELTAARLRMAIQNRGDALAEKFVFDQIDGKGQKIAEYGGALRGLLGDYYNLGALYGNTPDEAYVVDTGPTVNTPETIANRELRARLGIRTSPFAELAYIELVKVPTTEAL